MMNSQLIIIIAVVVLVFLGLIMAVVFSGRKRTENFQTKFGSEYDQAVETMGDDKKAQKELDERQKHVDALKIRPLTVTERVRYTSDWAAVQSKFVDEPGEAINAADRLITEVMQLRDYPVSDFEQRAADISVQYPALVTNYRAARAIAAKNETQQADTEELRQAMIYFRSLFDELVGTEASAVSAVKEI